MAERQAWQQDAVDGDPVLLSGAQEAVDVVELPLATWEPTGDAAVDALLERLAQAQGLMPSEQVEVFDALHQDLQARLGQGALEFDGSAALERG